MTRRRWLLAGLGLALLLAAFFLIRAALVLAGWGPDPTRPVEGWMTPRYLVRVYGLEPAALAPALGLEPGSAPRESLASIAARKGIPLADLIATVEALRPAP
ncbi:MAG: hypothetical protein ACK4S2_09960 [Gemmobacter sp.]|uniref:hypothetical protein n=1 Tax=Gemmobacter sp. TaxID=1898957 RepID=UPI00391D6CAF